MTSSGFRIGTYWIPFNHRWDWETEYSLNKLLNVRNIIKAASRLFWPPKILAWQKKKNQAPFKADSILFLFLDATDKEEEEEEVSVSERAAFQIRQFQVRHLGDCCEGPQKGTVSRPAGNRQTVHK